VAVVVDEVEPGLGDVGEGGRAPGRASGNVKTGGIRPPGIGIGIGGEPLLPNPAAELGDPPVELVEVEVAVA
jgi:hypothetical protein